jgi:putative tryptophan/tyrosine transport system substrate-binding protein
VPSLARPAGNLTGLSVMAAELQGKCVELLHDMLPFVRRVAALGYAADPLSKPFVDQVQLAGRATGNEINPIIMLNGPDEILRRSRRWRKRGPMLSSVGVLCPPNMSPISRSSIVCRQPQITDLYRRMASFVRKVLQGDKPAGIPVEQPTRFELVINLKTAKALGLTIPESFLLRADEVIEWRCGLDCCDAAMSAWGQNLAVISAPALGLLYLDQRTSRRDACSCLGPRQCLHTLRRTRVSSPARTQRSAMPLR